MAETEMDIVGVVKLYRVHRSPLNILEQVGDGVYRGDFVEVSCEDVEGFLGRELTWVEVRRWLNVKFGDADTWTIKVNYSGR